MNAPDEPPPDQVLLGLSVLAAYEPASDPASPDELSTAKIICVFDEAACRTEASLVDKRTDGTAREPDPASAAVLSTPVAAAAPKSTSAETFFPAASRSVVSGVFT
ncbi:hypothetical protein [Kitasatospora sp. SolWspMP-SS2h]|uniref:hypothetical protein n=1 Tax=Kitasatospora sp. SolWspMP-SS2h TaxID=1305729 RepID=UPI001F338F45|nr:hypothetical protein [Kitasatospora sp. SolWspMP-SS2h]